MKALDILKSELQLDIKYNNYTAVYNLNEAIEELEELQKRIDDINDLKRVQADSSIDDYTIGLHDGLELASSILENREPVYINTWNLL